MAISLVGHDYEPQYAYLGDASLTFEKPAGLVAGDLLLVWLHAAQQRNAILPAGWSVVREVAANAMTQVCAWKIYDGSEQLGPFEIDTSFSEVLQGALQVFRGADPVTPIEDSAFTTADGSGGLDATAPGVTSSRDGGAVSAWFAFRHPGGDDFYAEPAPGGLTLTYQQISTSGLNPATAGYEILPTAGTSQAYVAPQDAYPDNHNAHWAGQVAIRPGSMPPNAPLLTAPKDDAVLNQGAVNRFAWLFSDPDSGDSQSAFDLRYRPMGTATWIDVYGATPNNFWDAPAGTFVVGADYEWQVRTYDTYGEQGAWSSSSYFTAGDPPAMPTITDPVNGETIALSQHTVEWSAPDQNAFQVRTVADVAGTPDTATVYYDTGVVVNGTTRRRDVPFLTNNRTEHVQVRVRSGGLWSQWTSVRVQVSYTQTPAPTFVATFVAEDGAALVEVSNPPPGVGEPAVLFNDVEVREGGAWVRKVTGVPANGVWTYWTALDGVTYDAATVRVVAHADNGTTTVSA